MAAGWRLIEIRVLIRYLLETVGHELARLCFFVFFSLMGFVQS